MRRTTTAAALAGLALVLAACSPAADDPEAPPSPTTEAAQAEVSSEPAEDVAEPTEPVVSAEAACGAVMDANILERIPDALTSIGSDLGGEQLDELLAINGELSAAIDVATPEVAAPLRSLQVPFQQVQDVVDGGGGDLNMDTSDIMTDVAAFMEACVDAGYRIDE